MKNTNSQFIGQLIYEMQLRNYSSRTIRTYSDLLTKVEKFYNLPLDTVSVEKFKEYLHHRITKEEISVAWLTSTSKPPLATFIW